MAIEGLVAASVPPEPDVKLVVARVADMDVLKVVLRVLEGLGVPATVL